MKMFEICIKIHWKSVSEDSNDNESETGSDNDLAP